MERAKPIGDAKIKHPELIYSFVLMAVLCLLGGGNSIFSILILICFIPLMFKPEYLIGPVIFSSIWGNYIIVASGQSLARYLTLFFIFGVLVKVIQQKRKIKVDFWFITIILAILLGLMLSMFGIHGYTSIPTSYILTMFLFLVAIYCPISSKEVLIKQLWYFSILSIAYSCWFLLRNGLDAFDEGKIGMIEDGVNSNTVAKGICIVAIVILTHFLYVNLKRKIVHITLILMSVFLLFITGSRTALVAFIIAGTICILYWLRSSSKKAIGAIIVIAVSLILFTYIYNFLLEALPELMKRFALDDVLEDGGTGRIDVWKAYMECYFSDYWFFGIGFDPLNLYYAVENVNGIGHGAHNHIIDILASSGMVGLVLYFSMYIKAYKEGFKLAKTEKSVIIPLGMLTASLALGIGENVLRGRLLWFSIFLILMLKQVNEKKPI